MQTYANCLSQPHDVQLAAKRYLALGRTSLWWMTPAWGTTAAEIPTETQFLLAELEDGSCAVLLPLLPTVPTGRFRATLRSAGPGDLGVRVESGAAGVASDTFPSALLVAAGRDPFEVVARGVAAAAALSGTSKPSAAKEMPATADLFGCVPYHLMRQGEQKQRCIRK